jgi:hypothetical protein
VPGRGTSKGSAPGPEPYLLDARGRGFAGVAVPGRGVLGL